MISYIVNGNDKLDFIEINNGKKKNYDVAAELIIPDIFIKYYFEKLYGLRDLIS